MSTHRYVALAVFLAAVTGCGRSSAPTAPETASSPQLLQDQASLVVPMASQGKLDGLWPNEDGRSWSYAYRYGFTSDFPPQPTIYETKEEVPAAPAPEDLLPVLREPFHAQASEAGVYGLRFDGQKTTASGATGQNLVETLDVPSSLAPALVPSFRDRLLARVALARADLGRRIGTLSASPAALGQIPVLVHGGAWEKTLEHIGTYGDVDRDLAWKFLDADTRQGSSFRFQLLPSLTEDVFLSAWLVPHKLRTKASKGNAVEVVYVIDYGIGEVVDGSGSTIGYYRPIGYGSVTYDPGVGPVAMTERPIAWLESPEKPIGEITLSLQSGGLALGR